MASSAAAAAASAAARRRGRERRKKNGASGGGDLPKHEAEKMYKALKRAVKHDAEAREARSRLRQSNLMQAHQNVKAMQAAVRKAVRSPGKGSPEFEAAREALAAARAHVKQLEAEYDDFDAFRIEGRQDMQAAAEAKQQWDSEVRRRLHDTRVVVNVKTRKAQPTTLHKQPFRNTVKARSFDTWLAEKRSFERSRQGRRKREAAAYKAMCGPPPENVSLVINSQADTKFHETILWMDRSASPYATSKR